MRVQKLVTIMLVLLIAFSSAAPCFADGKDSGGTSVDTFLSVLKTWGSFLAVITGSYGSLENIALFSNFVKAWNDLITSDNFNPEGFFKMILRRLGIAITQPQPKEDLTESYSL